MAVASACLYSARSRSGARPGLGVPVEEHPEPDRVLGRPLAELRLRHLRQLDRQGRVEREVAQLHAPSHCAPEHRVDALHRRRRREVPVPVRRDRDVVEHPQHGQRVGLQRGQAQRADPRHPQPLDVVLVGLGGVVAKLARIDAAAVGARVVQRIGDAGSKLRAGAQRVRAFVGTTRRVDGPSAAAVADVTSIGRAAPEYWTKRTMFQGMRVYQRDDLIAPHLSVGGRSNLDRMKAGNAPIGPDGKPVTIHHMLQTHPGRSQRCRTPCTRRRTPSCT